MINVQDSSEIINLILITIDSSERLIYIHSFITCIKSYHKLNEAASISIQILKYFKKHPLIKQLMLSELTQLHFESFKDENISESVERLLYETETVATMANHSSKQNILMNKLVRHFIKFNTTFSELQSQSKLLNSVPGSTIKLPETKYKLMKEFKSYVSLKCFRYVLCGTCKKYIKIDFFCERLCHCKQCDTDIVMCSF